MFLIYSFGGWGCGEVARGDLELVEALEHLLVFLG